MGGLIITPREVDYKCLTAHAAANILREVTISESEMSAIARKLHNRANSRMVNKGNDGEGVKTENALLKSLQDRDISVGIMHTEKVCFKLNGKFTAKGETITDQQEVCCTEGGIAWNGNIYSELTFIPEDEATCSFILQNVTIGIGFHWQRQEDQTFKGRLRLIVDEEKLVVINELPVEEYLESVISSEMNATSSLGLLKTHAVVSRSWVYSQMLNRLQGEGRPGDFFNFVHHPGESVKWHDRSDHTLYDVCADDHCQRYQGITRATLPQVHEAVVSTAGEVLMFEGKLCDTRFSKSCGGISERYSSCWGNEDFAYLQPVYCDVDNNESLPDLTNEEEAERWIRTEPKAFCNTNDKNS